MNSAALIETVGWFSLTGTADVERKEEEGWMIFTGSRASALDAKWLIYFPVCLFFSLSFTE